LRQDPGRAEESPADARTYGNENREMPVVVDVPPAQAVEPAAKLMLDAVRRERSPEVANLGPESTT
jgi:hypothetical protein